MSQIRLFVETKDFCQNKIIEIADKDFDYLFKVMRKKIGDEILLLNNQDGEWLGKIISADKKSCSAQLIKQTKEFYQTPNISLGFALVKNVRIDFIAAKATELGVRNFIPLTTKHSIVDKINIERFQANIKEACEQCERTDLPKVFPLITLAKCLKTPETKDKILILCDESGQGSKANILMPEISKIKKLEQEIVLLTGPEGGFSKEEFELMKQLPNLYSLNLGPRILRADTAIISALTLTQEFLGDFDQKPNFIN